MYEEYSARGGEIKGGSDMPRVGRLLVYPQRARLGMNNGNFKHGAYCLDLLTEAERKQYDSDKERYLKAYPYLNEPVALDMLHEALILKIRIQRLTRYILNPNTPIEETISAQKVLDAFQRTLTLFFNRLGITYVSRQRRKEPKKVKTPLEMITEGNTG